MGELENAIERVVVLAQGEQRLEDSPPEVLQRALEGRAGAPLLGDSLASGGHFGPHADSEEESS